MPRGWNASRSGLSPGISTDLRKSSWPVSISLDYFETTRMSGTAKLTYGAKWATANWKADLISR